MVIKSLVLHNFGLYAGTNKFDFDSDKPVILIGGMNGRGKTTLLESVLLSLYGRRSFAFSESRLSYPAYLKKLINTSDNTLETYIEMEFVTGKDDLTRTYKLKRKWSAKQKDIKDNISVYKNGDFDAFLSDNWAMYIEEILPSAISNFFFFDGEKISELAVESTGEQMRNSIKTLLGIDVLDRLENDLKKIRTNKNKTLIINGNEKEIDTLQIKLDDLELKADEIRCNIAQENSFNGDCQRELDKCEAKFLAQGGKLGASKAELLNKKSGLENDLQDINEQLLEMVSGELPLALVSGLLDDVLDHARKEQDQKSIKYAAERIEELFGLFAKNESKVNAQVNAFINFVKVNTTVKSEDDIFHYDLSENGYTQATMLCNSFLHNKVGETKKLKAKRTKLRNEIDEIENYLSVEVDEIATGATYKKIMELNAKIGGSTEKKKLLTEQLNQLEVEIASIKKEQSKLIEKSLSELESMDESARTMKYSHYALSLLQEYRLRLQEQKTKKLANTMTKCYKKIANKATLISKILIDPVSLDFIYYDYNGGIVSKNKLSAGEKQLMVFAMLWSFALCSNNKLPVIIDTPLARLDSIHREKLIKNYFPNASEQTIILSTDSEIGTEYHKMLQPFIGKEYTLIYDDTTQSSSIVSGFFGGESR
ncbi:MAG: DNA sulfur modification protein DndD [Clostridiales bacterium 43-6]|nr:MAG: DNA sulfur modification protein DndD [Clostridiales bacterium 43-6]